MSAWSAIRNRRNRNSALTRSFCNAGPTSICWLRVTPPYCAEPSNTIRHLVVVLSMVAGAQVDPM
ncbi:hypothetical protein T01_4793 [Trichinella spiralis]|uniref:Uncharacterized protein n=1 Tax=Trichinella spiralis TaxID=6334 RepID=A0A0V1BWW6_TRISP|nr:hypothetical protein T01_4793 [Trichinella spiralis]